jgi:hypothetical protein
MPDLSKVAIGIKTLLRDEALFVAIQGIRDTMPEAQMIIADDGEMTEEKDGIYADLIREGHKIIVCPFDSGFGYKSNKIAEALDRPYLLIGSDDFDFRPPSVRKGIEKMLDVLESTDIDIVGGRCGWPYEFTLEDRGDTVIEHPLRAPISPEIPWYIECDLTVNYKLIKKHVFEKVKWIDSVRIGGGEHGFWFLQVKRAGFKVAWVPGAEIQEQKNVNSPRYWQYRSRSSDSARPCFDAIGVRKYVLGNGQIDYEAKA